MGLSDQMKRRNDLKRRNSLDVFEENTISATFWYPFLSLYLSLILRIFFTLDIKIVCAVVILKIIMIITYAFLIHTLMTKLTVWLSRSIFFVIMMKKQKKTNVKKLSNCDVCRGRRCCLKGNRFLLI